MTRLHFSIILSVILHIATIISAQVDNFDRYCGKSITFAQNNCPLQCASGTDQQCIDVLGEEYKCFNLTGCFERIQNGEVFNTTTDGTTDVEGNGVCAATLNNALWGCDIRVACSGDLNCAVGEKCYSDIGCGNPLMELVRYVHMHVYLIDIWISKVVCSNLISIVIILHISYTHLP